MSAKGACRGGSALLPWHRRQLSSQAGTWAHVDEIAGVLLNLYLPQIQVDHLHHERSMLACEAALCRTTVGHLQHPAHTCHWSYHVFKMLDRLSSAFSWLYRDGGACLVCLVPFQESLQSERR